MKNYFYILLFFTSLSFGQTEFTAIKLKNTPVTIDDTTQVDLLVREKTGSNKGLVRKITWPYLKSVIAPGNLPKEFFVSMTWDSINMGRYITYKTDTYRRLDLMPFVNDSIYGMFNSPEIVGNDIFLQGQYFPEGSGPGNHLVNAGKGERFFLALYNCKIINDELVVGSSAIRTFTGLDIRPSNGTKYNLHDSEYSRGYIYYTSRAYETATQVFKINPWNLNDYKYISLPTTTGYGTAGDAKIYKNWIYIFGGVSTSVGSYIIKVHENLDRYESLFIVGNLSGTKRVKQASCFEIYNDEIYIPTINNTSPPAAYDTMGFSVYGLDGTLKREVSGLTISTGSTGQPTPHWITIFGGKIIMHTAGSPNANKRLVRIDAYTLALEESILLDGNYTASNTITSEGYIYLNPEGQYGRSLMKYYYLDFAGTYEAIDTNSPLYYYSIGSPTYYVEPEGLKYKLSEFKNDLTGIGTVTSVTGTSDITIANGTTTPVIGISSSYTTARNSYADAKVTDIINDGATTIAPSQNAVNDALALKGNLSGGNIWSGIQTYGTSIVVQGNAIVAGGNSIQNNTANNFSLGMGNSLTPPTWRRNTSDAISTAVFNNANASSTGNIIDFQSSGTTQVSVTKNGNLYFPSSSDGIVLTSPDGTKYLITVADNGTLQTSLITTP